MYYCTCDVRAFLFRKGKLDPRTPHSIAHLPTCSAAPIFRRLAAFFPRSRPRRSSPKSSHLRKRYSRLCAAHIKGNSPTPPSSASSAAVDVVALALALRVSSLSFRFATFDDRVTLSFRFAGLPSATIKSERQSESSCKPIVAVVVVVVVSSPSRGTSCKSLSAITERTGLSSGIKLPTRVIAVV